MNNIIKHRKRFFVVSLCPNNEGHDAQEVVPYVGTNQQRGPMGVSFTIFGHMGLDLGTAPHGPESRQYVHRVHG